ncbi:MAG: hypothetical protein BTN85_1429 [Candidatus Methanohalarchaeum thermophilum]|uniref:Uncharacterized protein n=1 Tax=Methanohalarchaeum thermophilum TaxID=1903181 RepID=A0A1Q6DX27_METT1|nr:MAG: hypothetical protein BTN85_1429 [Candidatus Methanohalarchaeum thermophilum]
MDLKKALKGLKQRIIDVDIQKVKDKIIEINHFFSRIFRKIIIIDHDVLAFLSVVFLITGSLVGFGICTMRQEDGRTGYHGDPDAMILELETELSSVRRMLEVKDSKIEALESSLSTLRKEDEKPRIIAVEMNSTTGNVSVCVDFFDPQVNQLGLIAIGVKSVESESEWYYQDPIAGDITSTKIAYYWLKENVEAPQDFLETDTWYRVAVWYFGGYDEVIVNSSEGYYENDIQVK